MKKLVINISDPTYEKLKFESMELKKDIPTIIKERIFERAFSPSVEEAYHGWLANELEKMIQEI